MGVQRKNGEGDDVLHADLTAALEDGVGALRALEASRLHMEGAPGDYDDARSDIATAIASVRHAIAMIRSRTLSEHTSALAAGFVIPGRRNS
jgi:hypothetical protein